jgi:uncharacterized membrane protein YdjX (TVP38/TMEM64 family)
MSISARTRDRLRRLGPTGLLALLWTAAPALFGFALLAWIGDVSDWLNDRGNMGLVIYVVVFIVAAGCGLLPTYAQAILGGWVFGFALGLPAALIGFTGAGLIGYAIARTVSQDRVEQTIAENPKALAVRNALVARGFWKTLLIVTLLRFPPNSPFALTNLVMASSGVAVVPFVLGTLIGMMPRTAVAVLFAAAASREARDIVEFAREGPGTVVLISGIVVMFIVLGIIGVIANRALERIEPKVVTPATDADESAEMEKGADVDDPPPMGRE